MNDTDKVVHISPPKRIEYAAVTALFVLAAFLAVEGISALYAMGNPTTPPVETINVSGQGQAALAPDIAHITFSVQNTAPAVADAQAATTKQANAAIAYVSGQGIADQDVTTLSYNIAPQYSYQQCIVPQPITLNGTVAYSPCSESSKITGYQVSETVQVTVHDLTKVGTLLAGLGKQQVQNVSGPNFALENPTAGQDAARAVAITNAKQEAQTLAAQLGVRLGRIVSFSDNAGGGVYPMALNAVASGAGATPAIPTGQNTYTDNVSITYEIH